MPFRSLKFSYIPWHWRHNNSLTSRDHLRSFYLLPEASGKTKLLEKRSLKTGVKCLKSRKEPKTGPFIVVQWSATDATVENLFTKQKNHIHSRNHPWVHSLQLVPRQGQCIHLGQDVGPQLRRSKGMAMRYRSPWGKGVGTQGIQERQDPERKKPE